jgi:hypothetical protein
MGDTIIITDEDKPKLEPTVVVVAPEPKPTVEKVVTEKTTVVETTQN